MDTTTTARASVVAILVLTSIAVSEAVSLDDGQTFVWNLSQRAVVATTSYSRGTSGFIDRAIEPGEYQGDEYSFIAFDININIWVQDSSNFITVPVEFGQSIICYDNNDSSGVNIVLTKVDKPAEPLNNPPKVLTTIYP